jgi:hypothetical protein
MRVLLTPNARLEFDSLGPAVQQTILEVLDLEGSAAQRSSPSRTGPVRIRLHAPPLSLEALVSTDSVLLVSIQRLSP